MTHSVRNSEQDRKHDMAKVRETTRGCWLDAHGKIDGAFDRMLSITAVYFEYPNVVGKTAADR